MIDVACRNVDVLQPAPGVDPLAIDVANSQFSSFANGQLYPQTRLFETVILRLPLN
jgi:hypothetical protein